jgi:hypothetical protein
MTLQAGGNVGIKQVNPSHRLDVDGTFRTTGVATFGSTLSNGTYNYTLPSATGTLALTSQLSSGTVTSVATAGTVSGLTLTGGTITTSGTITLGGTLSLTSGNVTTALGYTPLNKAGDTMSGILTMGTTAATNQYIRMGLFPNLQTNTGEAWIGRASDRNAGTMTVQLGGNSASGRSFEVVDYAWSVVLFSVSSGGAGSFSSSVTASSFSGAGTGLTGTAASLSIGGNASTATALSSGQSNWSGTGVINNVVGMLAWKNYGNSHVIFDASQSTNPSGGGCNNTNSTAAWTATYPTLMGWNGSTTYGVRVDSARVADSAGSATTATYATNSTRLYASDNPYCYGCAAPYYLSMTYDGTRWFLQTSPASPSAVRVSYADSAGSATLAANTSSISNAVGGAYTWTGAQYFLSNRNTTSDSPPLQAYANNGSGAIMSFHRAGAYAVNFGLDSDNVMRIGGWSAAANRWQLDMSGNMTVAGLVRAGTNVYTDTNYGYGLVGAYASTRFQGVFAMGDAYKLPADGSSPGNLYGLSWSYPAAGGQAGFLDSHGLLVMINGSTGTAISNSIWARANITANGNFYTSNYIYGNIYAGNAYGALMYSNNGTTYTQWRIAGSKNGYGGIVDEYSNVNGIMYDNGGNGGVYREVGGGWYWYYYVPNACMGINGSATSSAYGLYVTGSIYTTGTVTQASDVRKKTDIVTIDNALEKVTQMRGVYFTKIGEEEKGRQTGVIAQEMNEILPEVVIHAKDVDEYSVAYGNAIGVLIEAIKEQQLQIEQLKQLIKQ